MYHEWKDDAVFIKEYNAVRHRALLHHRAHERMKPGKGEWASALKNELVQVDIRRGASITYS
jgi:hypothetical protein